MRYSAICLGSSHRRAIVPGVSLLALLLLPILQLTTLASTNAKWRCLLFLQLLDALVGLGQLLVQRLIFGPHRAQLFQVDNFFLSRHTISLSKKAHYEQYRES